MIRDIGIMNIDSRFIPCLEVVALYSVSFFFSSDVSRKTRKNVSLF